MLVLSRKEGQVIWIGDDIKIMVTEIESVHGVAQAHIGIEAPAHIQIVREEIKLRFDNKGNKI